MGDRAGKQRLCSPGPGSAPGGLERSCGSRPGRPSLRADLESRLEECARVRRTMAEENRVSLTKVALHVSRLPLS